MRIEQFRVPDLLLRTTMPTFLIATCISNERENHLWNGAGAVRERTFLAQESSRKSHQMSRLRLPSA